MALMSRKPLATCSIRAWGSIHWSIVSLSRTRASGLIGAGVLHPMRAGKIRVSPASILGMKGFMTLPFSGALLKVGAAALFILSAAAAGARIVSADLGLFVDDRFSPGL